MGKLTIHDPNKSREEIQNERDVAFNALSPTEKFFRLLALNKLAINMNGGKPLKTPQGKGIIIRKKKN